MFKCTRFRGIDDVVLLVVDYSVQCHQDEHATFTVVAIVFLIVYIVGIPFIMFMLLWWHRKHLHDVNSKKHLMVKNALGGLYLQYEPKYWWFELMMLLNKTIMCGGLVILSPGSPSQVLCGVLFMLFHLLVVLKLSPFENDSEDVSSVAASLGLTLIYIGALMKMLEAVYKNMNGGESEQDDRVNMSYIGVALDTLPLVCVGVVVGIVIVLDCGVYACCCKKKGKKKGKGKTEKIRKKKKKKFQHKEMKTSVEDSNAQQPKSSIGVKLRRAINRIPEYKNTIAVEEQHTATSELHQRKAINTKRKLAKGRLVSRLKKQRSVNGKTGGKDRSKVVPVTAVMTEVGKISEGAGNVQL